MSSNQFTYGHCALRWAWKEYLYRAYIQMIVRNHMDTLNIVPTMADDGNRYNRDSH